MNAMCTRMIIPFCNNIYFVYIFHYAMEIGLIVFMTSIMLLSLDSHILATSVVDAYACSIKSISQYHLKPCKVEYHYQL